MKIYNIQRKQFLPISIQEAWEFFSTPKNLSKITPEHMGFKILYISGGRQGICRTNYSLPCQHTTRHQSTLGNGNHSIEAIEKTTRDLRLTIEQDNARLSLNHALRSNLFSTALALHQQRLTELVNLLEHQAVRSPGLEQCWKRATIIHGSLNRWQDQLEQEGYVRWVETFNQALHLNATPLSIAETFSKQLSVPPRAWIFTSATLAVKDDFSHYQQAMGLAQAQSIRWESPYNFAHQALLYVPTGLPSPNNQHFTAALIEAILPVLKASQGRAFILCTSLITCFAEF